jgi:four helix bundle protein
MEKIQSHRELRVYKMAFETAQQIFKISLKFPPVEKYALTAQVRRSSRSVAVNIAEAFRSRRYPNSFVSKLNTSECEAAETQSWIEFAQACEYIQDATMNEIYEKYEYIIGMIINMSNNPGKWKIG